MDISHLLEALESRQLVSASTPVIDVSPTSVIVTGSEGPDHIEVESVDTGSGMLTVVQVNGVKVQTASNLKLILVDGMGGDDVIKYDGIHLNTVPSIALMGSDGADQISIREVARTDSSEFQWTTISGGNGEDRIEIFSTRYANVYGNNGNDHLVSLSGAGNAWHNLQGDDGDDYLINRSNRGANLSGGAGNDVLDDRADDEGSFFDGGSGQNVMIGGPGSDTAYIKDVATNYFFAGGGNDWVSIHRYVPAGILHYNGESGQDSLERRDDLWNFQWNLVSVESVYQYGDFYGIG